MDDVLPPCCFATDGDPPGKKCYAAYNYAGEHRGLNYRGEPCPEWDDLTQDIRDKWDAVAAAKESPQVMDLTAKDLDPDLMERLHEEISRWKADGTYIPVLPDQPLIATQGHLFDAEVLKMPRAVTDDPHFLLGMLRVNAQCFYMECFRIADEDDGPTTKERRAHPDMDPEHVEQLNELWHAAEPDACFEVMEIPAQPGQWIVIMWPHCE